MTEISSMITKILWNTKVHISRDAITFLSKELEIAGEEILKLATNEYATVESSNIKSIEKCVFTDKLDDINTTGKVFYDVIMKILENNKIIISHDAIITLAQLLEKITIKILEQVQKRKHITKTDIETAENELFGISCEVVNNRSKISYAEKTIDLFKNIYCLLTIQKEIVSSLIKDPIP